MGWKSPDKGVLPRGDRGQLRLVALADTPPPVLLPPMVRCTLACSSVVISAPSISRCSAPVLCQRFGLFEFGNLSAQCGNLSAQLVDFRRIAERSQRKVRYLAPYAFAHLAFQNF